jgi:D-alanyl-D-alanine carboxypeptidase/D-alanyl-D-alanine-endopeptidase (penicillin-binding protein 4)
MAECLFLRSAVEPGSPATWERAAKVAEATLTGRYGLAAEEFRVADGSGFSRSNRVAAAAITRLLQRLAGEKIFVDSLAVAGVDGSLRRAQDLPEGRILGKTGTLAGVSALSGYVTGSQGGPSLAFSILVNGRTAGKRHDAKGLQGGICHALVRLVDAPAATSAPTSQPATAPAR